MDELGKVQEWTFTGEYIFTCEAKSRREAYQRFWKALEKAVADNPSFMLQTDAKVEHFDIDEAE